MLSFLNLGDDVLSTLEKFWPLFLQILFLLQFISPPLLVFCWKMVDLLTLFHASLMLCFIFIHALYLCLNLYIFNCTILESQNLFFSVKSAVKCVLTFSIVFFREYPSDFLHRFHIFINISYLFIHFPSFVLFPIIY